MDYLTLNRDQLAAKWKYIYDKVENDIWSWTGLHDCAALCEWASKANAILEIGSYHGRSAKVMALASNPTTDIYCIDNFENVGCEEIFRLNLKEEIASEKVVVARGTSDLIKYIDPEVKFDLIFIDAGHTLKDVIRDIINSIPRLNQSGIICGHDWRDNNPQDEVNLAVESCFKKESIHVFESIWCIKGTDSFTNPAR